MAICLVQPLHPEGCRFQTTVRQYNHLLGTVSVVGLIKDYFISLYYVTQGLKSRTPTTVSKYSLNYHLHSCVWQTKPMPENITCYHLACYPFYYFWHYSVYFHWKHWSYSLLLLFCLQGHSTPLVSQDFSTLLTWTAEMNSQKTVNTAAETPRKFKSRIASQVRDGGTGLKALVGHPHSEGC